MKKYTSRPFPAFLAVLRLIIIATLGIALNAPFARAGVTDSVKAVTLKNGLRVLLLENHKAPVAAFSIFYKVGSRNEQVGKTGISHLVEHLMFRGNKRLKPEEFSNIIQENGGIDNAFTTEDYTDYFEVINKNRLEVPISLEAERMGDFAPHGFDSEKAVVIEERRLRTEDNPEDALGEMVQAQAFVEHPYHWPVIGWMHDVQQLTLKDAIDYHRKYYSPANAIVVSVGDFDAEKVKRQIEENFGGLPNLEKPPPFNITEPVQQGERRVELRRPAELPAIALAYHVPNYSSPDGYALELAAQILAGGKSSRLYRKLVVEKQMVVAVDASYSLLSFDPTLFWISAQLRRGVKPDEVLRVLDGEIHRLATVEVGQHELQKAKNQEGADFVFGQDSMFRQAMLLGQYEMLGSYRMLDQYLPSLDKVAAADVKRVASQYLVPRNRTVGILVPTGVAPHHHRFQEAGGVVH